MRLHARTELSDYNLVYSTILPESAKIFPSEFIKFNLLYDCIFTKN